MNGPAQIQSGVPMAMNRGARCPCSAHTQSIGRAHFNPKLLCEQLIEAILPLLNSEGDLIAGKADIDVIGALKPVLGDFTVEEAIYLYVVLGIAEQSFERAETEDDPRFMALLQARWILQDFVGNAYSSGPGCASARAWLARFALWEEEESASSPKLSADILGMMSWDVSDMRHDRFHGDRFFAEPDTFEPRWFSIMNIKHSRGAQ